MGCGSGRGTFDLASLYDGLELVGVDVNTASVQRAREKFKRPNLSYLVGDISQMVFPANSLDGILNSSVLHHVTSFNNFDVDRVFTTLDNQVAQLRLGGVIIIRDFVIPDGPERVFLDLPLSDGAESGSKRELSTAALFEVFAEEWRSSVNPDGPVRYESLKSPRDGFARFQLTLRAATEFVLRKDYSVRLGHRSSGRIHLLQPGSVRSSLSRERVACCYVTSIMEPLDCAESFREKVLSN